MIITPRHLCTIILGAILFIINMTSKFFTGVLPEIFEWEVAIFIIYLYIPLVLFSGWIGVRITVGLMFLIGLMGVLYWAMII